MAIETIQNPTTITWLQAKQSVAATTGGQDSANEQARAGECLRDALLALNNKRNWKFLRRIDTQASVTSGTLTLPATLKKIYSVVISSSTANYTRSLRFMDRRNFDREVDQSTALGGIYTYTAYNLDASGTIAIHDAPTATTPVTVVTCYLRDVIIPPGDTDKFDLPEKVMPFVFAEAKSLYLASKQLDASFWMRKSMEYLRDLIIEDEKELDSNPTFSTYLAEFTPSTNWAVGYSVFQF